jgi:hypothetical protein
MKMILGGINGEYLRNITDNHMHDTEEVLAAVAYASEATLLFDWCWEHRIPLKFYGRLDDGVAVSAQILATFLERKSTKFHCRLVQHHHAKVIWWRGVGVYIGSANLSNRAWYINIEAGCFFPEAEIGDEMAQDLRKIFSTLEDHATPLTEEVVEEMRKRVKSLALQKQNAEDFWNSPSFVKWDGLNRASAKRANDRRRDDFLREWHSTLQYLRDIGARVSEDLNRPSWVDASAPVGAQADQFLHGHYYTRTFVGQKANYAALYEENKGRQEEALAEALHWWQRLPEAPQQEDQMLNVTAPNLRRALTKGSLEKMTYPEFQNVCMSVHAIKDYARRVSNKSVGLIDSGIQYSIPEKVAALSNRIWNDRTAAGLRVTELISHILYEGSADLLPERLWDAVALEKWKLDGLGISALGELVGWALPDRFPPRNGRTSKALRSLGFDVEVHV